MASEAVFPTHYRVGMYVRMVNFDYERAFHAKKEKKREKKRKNIKNITEYLFMYLEIFAYLLATFICMLCI